MKNIGLMKMTKPWLLAAGLILCHVGAAMAADRPAQTIFGAQTLPSKGKAQSIGFYSRGCLAGGRALPLRGPYWQVLYPQRNRYWGHPALINYIERLSRRAASQGWPGLLVGDMAQPRGGPMPNGHASHQVGLDADIWYTPMPPRIMSAQERRTRAGISMLQGKSLYVDPGKWSPAHTQLLKLAAMDNQTDRIFVHPGIKKHLCDTVTDERAWLGKLRPYWGHDRHFHVRLKCQSGSPLCLPQRPVPKSSGCDASLDWWFSDEPWIPEDTTPAAPKTIMLSDLPHACAVLVEKNRQ